MGIELARAFIGVAANTQQVGPELTHLRSDVDRQFQGMADNIESTMGGMVNSLMGSFNGLVTLITGIASTVTGSMMAMTHSFAGAGDQFDKMAYRIGIGREALQELGFAAEQSGASLRTIETAMMGLQRRIQSGSKGFQEAIGELGISYDQLQTMSPEEQLTILMDRLGGVEDESKRAGLAMATLGRSGMRLGAMMAGGAGGLTALREEKRRLGIMSEEEIKLAAELTDAWNRFKHQMSLIKNLIGVAVAPLFIEWSNNIQDTLMWVRDFIRTNEALIQTVFKSAVIITKATAAYMSFRASIWAVGKAFAFVNITGLGGFIAASVKATASMFTMSGAANLLSISIRGVGIALNKALIGTGVGAIFVALGAAILGVVWGIQELFKWATSLESVQKSLGDASERLHAAWIALQEAGAIVFAALTDAVNSLVESIADYLGVEIDELPNTLEGAINWMIDSVSNFALNVASYVQAIVSNWQLSWDIVKTYVALKLTEMADAGLVFWNTLKAGAVAGGVYMWEILKNLSHNIALTFEGVGRIIIGTLTGIWEAAKALFSGGDVGDAFAQAFAKELNKMQGELVSVTEGASEKAGEAFIKHMGADSPLAGTIDALKDDLSKMTGQISEAATVHRQKAEYERARRKEADDVAEDVAEEFAKDDHQGDSAAQLAAGRYGITDLGTRMQDLMLGEEDKMIGLTEQGNRLQEEELELQKEIRDELKKERRDTGAMVLS